MDLRQVEYVLAVVERGSFTKAAASIPVSQPSLSDGIRRLESELGVRLFHRLGRSVELTDAGRAFVGPARRLTRDRDAVFESVATVRDLQSGTLDIVALPTLAADPLGRLVGGFRKANPGIAVRIAAPCAASASARRAGRNDVPAPLSTSEAMASRCDVSTAI